MKAARAAVLALAFLSMLSIAFSGEMPVQEDTIEAYYKEELKKPKEQQSHPHLVPATMKVGDMGMMPYAFNPAKPKPFVVTTIASIVDDRSLVLKCDNYTLVASIRSAGNKEYVGPPSPKLSSTTYFLLKRTSTAGKVDGRGVQIATGLQVIGTEKVDTPEGAKTVFVLAPHNLRTLDIDK